MGKFHIWQDGKTFLSDFNSVEEAFSSVRFLQVIFTEANFVVVDDSGYAVFESGKEVNLWYSYEEHVMLSSLDGYCPMYFRLGNGEVILATEAGWYVTPQRKYKDKGYIGKGKFHSFETEPRTVTLKV